MIPALILVVVVATKTFTQTLGHLTKLGYYGTLMFLLGDGLRLDDRAPPWLFLAVIPMALVGTRIGTRILDRLEEHQFRRVSEQVILAIGTACIFAGGFELLS